ncbi:GMC oxidoreductase-domain-containing protein [Apodospora peruviana]|uniref:GMC oxidoreductase-domain-containing protein n=1 Tax=Apodospora peruviana TaxID=516989 RepID=A0AAE0HUT9_9PEZI|nr:GMC oxidoreductase-domain-containing protein [Apodospora peruviana]
MRGLPGSYNEWAEKYGLDGWSWDRAGTELGHTSARARTPSAMGMRAGEVMTDPSRFDNPLPHLSGLNTYIEKAAHQLGLPVEKDYNNPNAPAMGFFHTDMAIDRSGKRASTYRAFLPPHIAQARKSHLPVCTSTVVSRLELDTSSSQVQGVHILTPKSSSTKREIIICSGAICTPQILLLSGIGPAAAHLAELDIPLRKDLPVGSALQDHYSVTIMLEVPKSETITLLESIHGLWNILLWLFSGTGLMATLSVSWSSSDLLDASSPSNIPDAEIMIPPVSSFERHVPGYSVITLFPTLVQPLSRGKIEVLSKDPLANPKIFHPMLQDERDLVPFWKAIRFAMRLAEEFVLRSWYPLQPARLTFAPGVNPHLLEAWEATAPPYEVHTDKVTAEGGGRIHVCFQS